MGRNLYMRERILIHRNKEVTHWNHNHAAFTEALMRGLATPEMTKGEKQGSLLVFLIAVFFVLL